MEKEVRPEVAKAWTTGSLHAVPGTLNLEHSGH